MAHFLDVVLNQYGRPVPSLTVNVYQGGTVTPATIYSDNLVTQKPNPFTSNTDGTIDFWVVTGTYDIALSGGSPAITPKTFTIDVGSSSGSGNGFQQSKQISTGSIPAGSGASVTVTWDTPFADATYKFTVDMLESVSPGGGALRILQVESISTTAITVRVVNDDDTNAHTGTIYALAF